VGAELVSVRQLEHVARRQRFGLLLLGTLALAWGLAPIDGPEPFIGSIVIGAALGAAIESFIVSCERCRADVLTDELIECGFTAAGRADHVSRAIDRRIHELDSERTRRRLADHLRWHVDLDRQCRTIRGVRCAPIPPIRGFAANADLVNSVATAIERGSCDPRIAIRINRLLAVPLAPLPDIEAESERLREFLLEVQRLCDDCEPSPAHPSGGGIAMTTGRDVNEDFDRRGSSAANPP
jgi:hypothetical protein